MKKLTKLEYTGISFLLIFGICGIAYSRIGSYVDAQGFLVEPFYLTAIGGLSLYIGIGLIIISIIMRIIKCFKDNK